MKKRGVSAIVATVLIILITVSAVAILWAAVIPMIRDNLDFSSLEGRVSVVTSAGYTAYDSGSEYASVQVKRDVDEENMTKVKIMFSIAGNTVGNEVPAPAAGNTKVYFFDLSGQGEPDSVSVAPVFVVGNREKEGSVTSEAKISKGTVSAGETIYEIV